MEEYIVAALGNGLKRLIFLEHFEAGINYFESTWLSPEKFLQFRQEGETLREKYKGKIIVGLGVEVGFNPLCIDEIKDFLRAHAWDRVGLSCHFFYHEGKHVNMLSRKKANLAEFTSIGIGKVLDEYFNNLLQAVDQIPANVLCHLDAVLRHHDQVRFDKRHLKLIRTILQHAAERQIALEVNTSGFPLRGEPFPSLSILKMAQKQGLDLVAGSDAHRPRDVGRFFDRLPRLLDS
jgi:histidinol-phosphatase (PHP family)